VYDFQNPNGPRNLLAGSVDGGGHPTDEDNANSECAGWIPLAQFNRWVWIRCHDVTLHPNGYLRVDNHAALLRYRKYLSSDAVLAVPSIIGLTTAAATAAIRAAGLTVGQITNVLDRTCNNIGTVLGQNPDPGTSVQAGSAVSLSIGQKPPPPFQCP
jgi:PASTA domain